MSNHNHSPNRCKFPRADRENSDTRQFQCSLAECLSNKEKSAYVPWKGYGKCANDKSLKKPWFKQIVIIACERILRMLTVFYACEFERAQKKWILNVVLLRRRAVTRLREGGARGGKYPREILKPQVPP